MDLFVELRDLLDGLRREKVSYALCGGLALAVYGIMRATEDIDLLIEETELPKLRGVAEALGFRFDPRPFEFKDGSVRIYRLVKARGEDLVVLDLLLVTELTRPAWESRRQVETEFGIVPAVSPEGLVQLKSLRGSGQDQEDIRRLKELRHED